MLIDLGLTRAEFRAYELALRYDYVARTRVQVLDGNDEVVGNLAGRVLSGAVSIDATADVTRSLSLEVADTGRQLGFVPSSPREGHVYADNLLRVFRDVYVRALGQYVEVPVFTGPITRVEHGAATLAIEAQGKEVFGLEPSLLWAGLKSDGGERQRTLPKGTLVTTAIRRILTSIGERSFDLPELPNKLPHPLTLTRYEEPWPAAEHLARSIGRHLYYDGRGRVRLRRVPENRVYSFRTGPGGNVVSRPRVAWNLPSAANTTEVLGPEATGPFKRIRALAHARPAHPLSAAALARNGEPRYLVRHQGVDLPDAPKPWDKAKAKQRLRYRKLFLRRQADADDIALRELEDGLMAEREVAFEALPAYHLEELDRVGLYDDGEGSWVTFPLIQFSHPLVAGPLAQVGDTRKLPTGRHGVRGAGILEGGRR